jgi:hypothetical protein
MLSVFFILAATLSHGYQRPPLYTVQIDIIHPTDTVTAKLVLEEGVSGSVVVQKEASVTIVRAMVRQSVSGCLRVDVGSATGRDEDAILGDPATPNRTVHLCGVLAGGIKYDDGPLYRVIVELASPASF